jgi:hypothetical protein
MIDQEMGEHFHTASNPADKDEQDKRMKGLKRMDARAMDPEVNPLDGALLPLSPALAYVQERILPRILRNPLARSCQKICLPFFFLKFYIFQNSCQTTSHPQK